MEDVLREDSFVARRENGTGDAIGTLRLILERILDIEEESCACFRDWQTAFDSVNWAKLMQILKVIGIDWSDRRLVR